MDTLVRFIFLTLFILLSSGFARAQERLPGVFTYQGRAYQADGTTPLTGTATFEIQIRSSDGNCLLYQESHTGVDLTASAGLFALNIGDGSAKSGLNLTEAFSNVSQPKTTLSGTCGGVYIPATLDARVLRITVDTGVPVALDDQYIYSVPKALVADSLNGYTYNQFVQHLTTTQRDALTSMVNGTTIYNITTGRFNRYNGATWGDAFGASSVGAGSSIYKGKSAGNDWLELKSIIGSAGITATGNVNDVTLSIDPTYTQRRVSGTCGAGNFMTGVNQDGTVTCVADGGGTALAGDGVTIDGDGTAGDEFAVIPGGIDISTLSGELTFAQLPTGCNDNEILKMNGANWNCEADAGAGGGLTVVATDGTTIDGDGDATPIFLMDGGVTTAKIGDDQVTAAKIADGALDAVAKIATGLCAANQVLKKRADNTAWECAADATGAGLPAMTDAQIIVANGTTPAAVAMSGDVAIANTGATTIQNNAVETAMIADDQVTAAKVADGAVDAVAKIATGLCAANQVLKKRADNTAWECAADNNTTVNQAVEVDGVTIEGDGLILATALKVADNGIDTLQLATGAVETAKINDAAVTTVKINDGAVTAIKLADFGCADGDYLRWQDDTARWDCQAIPAGLAISGTTGTVPMFNGAGTNIEDSQIIDEGASGVSISSGIINMAGDKLISNPGTANAFVGRASGNSSVSGAGNDSLGAFTMNAVSSGYFNTAIGYSAMLALDTGNDNIAIGKTSMQTLTSGQFNTAVGSGSLGQMNGNSNVALGYEAGIQALNNSASNVFIGYQAGPTIGGTITNKLYIDNAADSTPLIYGDFANDRVGINKVATTYALEVNGDIEAAAYYYTSDQRLKENVVSLDGALNKVLQLRGVSFDWIENGKPEVGLIAQEVEAIYPDLVSTNNNGFKAVKYGNLVAPLIESTKELYGICKMSEEQTKALGQRVARNERDIASLKSDLAQKQEQIDFLMRELATIKAQLKK